MRGFKALIVGLCWPGAVTGLRLRAARRPKSWPTTIPMKQTNRQTLAFNGKIDRYFVVPTWRSISCWCRMAAGAASIISWAISACPPSS